jgi:hypothetical protein
MHSRVACACAGLGALFELLFGIVPFCACISHQLQISGDRVGCIPRPVILDVVFLDLLDVMVRLWVVHSLGTVHSLGEKHRFNVDQHLLFPCKIS